MSKKSAKHNKPSCKGFIDHEKAYNLAETSGSKRHLNSVYVEVTVVNFELYYEIWQGDTKGKTIMETDWWD